jgi:DNA-binding transcriptional regulator YiaG
MANFATVMKAEVSRLARKEVRAQLEGFRKVVSALRTEVSALKKQVRQLEAEARRQGKATSRGRPGQPEHAAASTAGVAPETSRFRFSQKGFASNRKRLGLSAREVGRLVGTTEQSIYAWERGASRPQGRFLPAIAELRGVGKREAARRLEALAASE